MDQGQHLGSAGRAGRGLSAEPANAPQRLSEKELCPDDLLCGQEEAFRRDIARLRAAADQFVDVDCPACGSRYGSVSFEKLGFRYLACSACDTVFMSPRPSAALMAAYYANSENYKYWAEYVFPASETARRDKLHRPRFNQIVAYCEKYGVTCGTLMEVGAGFGTFCAVAQESGWFTRVVAVEPTPEMADACRSRGITVIEEPVERIADEGAAADVVVAFEVIEHLFEPRVFLERCRTVLNRDGLLVLSCPNAQGFDIALLGARSLAVDPEHVNLFNPASLRRLVESQGFDVLEVTTPGRLDVEFVHDAIGRGEYDVADPFLRRVLVDEWDRLGWPFQQFLAAHGLSSHMWLAARKTDGV